MQTVPNVNLPLAPQRADPVKTRRGAESERFSPALDKAINDNDSRDELSGAAVVAANNHPNDRDERSADGSSKVETSKAETGKAETGKAETGKAETGKAETGKAETGKAETGKAETGKAETGKAEALIFQDKVVNKNMVHAEVTAAPLSAETAIKVPSAGANSNAQQSGAAIANLINGAKIEATVTNHLKGSELKAPAMDHHAVLDQIKTSATVEKLPVGNVTENNLTAIESPVVGQLVDGRPLNAVADKKRAKVADAKTTVINDPRFANLLNKPSVPLTLHQQQGLGPAINSASATDVFGHNQQQENGLQSGQTAAGELDTLGANTTLNPDKLGTKGAHGLGSQDSELGMLTSAEKGVTTNQLHLVHHASGTQGTATTLGATSVIPLKDGSLMPESQVVQQTIDHLSIHSRGDSSTVTVKLHPEELGELQLRMVMEGDKLSVHLHAQSHQVQEVLERNFPRLRDALQDMGVNVEAFQVSTGAGGQNNQQTFAQQDSSGGTNSGRSSQLRVDTAEGIEPALASAANANMAQGSGLSVRV